MGRGIQAARAAVSGALGAIQAGPGGARASCLDPEWVQQSRQRQSPGLGLRRAASGLGVWEVVHAQHPESAAPSCTWRDGWARQTPGPPTSPLARQLPLTWHPPTYLAPSQVQPPSPPPKDPGGGPNLSEGPTLSQTSVSRVFGRVPSLAYMVAQGEKQAGPFPQVLSWAAHLAGSQGEYRASHGAALPHAHQATDPLPMSPRGRAPPTPPVCLQLDRATGGPEAMSPSSSWECRGTRWWAVLPGAAVRGQGQFWVFCGGCRGGPGRKSSPALSCCISLAPASSGGPTGLYRVLPPGATALPWQLLTHPRQGLKPHREASPSGLCLAVRPASAHSPL